MIRIINDTTKICSCCDNDSELMIDFSEDNSYKNLGVELILCSECKLKLSDILISYYM